MYVCVRVCVPIEVLKRPSDGCAASSVCHCPVVDVSARLRSNSPTHPLPHGPGRRRAVAAARCGVPHSVFSAQWICRRQRSPECSEWRKTGNKRGRAFAVCCRLTLHLSRDFCSCFPPFCRCVCVVAFSPQQTFTFSALQSFASFVAAASNKMGFDIRRVFDGDGQLQCRQCLPPSTCSSLALCAPLSPPVHCVDTDVGQGTRLTTWR